MFIDFPFKRVFCDPRASRAVLEMQISCTAKAIYFFLVLSSGKKNHCWPSQYYIAERLSLGLRTVQRAIQELEEIGLVECRKPNNRENVYYMREHAIFSQDVEICGKAEIQAQPDGVQEAEFGLCPTDYDTVDPKEGGCGGCPGSAQPQNICVNLAHTQDEIHANLAYDSAKMAHMPANISAKMAHRNIYKSKTQSPPYPPSPNTRRAPDHPVQVRGVGGVSSSPVSSEVEIMESAFSAVWDLWPVKQDRQNALTIWKQLWFAKKLPAPEALFEKIHLLQTKDRWWLNGKAPLLSKWLKGERWNDEPVPVITAETASARPNSSEMQENTVLTPRENAQKAAAAQFIQELHEREAEQSKVKNEEALRSFVEQYSLPENDPRKNKFMRFYPEHIRASLEQKARNSGLL